MNSIVMKLYFNSTPTVTKLLNKMIFTIGKSKEGGLKVEIDNTEY